MREQKPPQQMSSLRFMGVGVTWALSTALFLYIGMVVDGWQGTKPVFSLMGAFIGIVGGFWYVYRQAQESLKRKDDGQP